MRIRVNGGSYESFALRPVELTALHPRELARGREAREEVVEAIARWLSTKHHDLHYLTPCVAVVQRALREHPEASYWPPLRGAKPWAVLYAWANAQRVSIRRSALASQERDTERHGLYIPGPAMPASPRTRTPGSV